MEGLKKTQELKASFATERDDLLQQIEGKDLRIRILETEAEVQRQEYAGKVALFTSEFEKMQALGQQGATLARNTGGHVKELEDQVEDLTKQLKLAKAGKDGEDEGDEEGNSATKDPRGKGYPECEADCADNQGKDGDSTDKPPPLIGTPTPRERWLQERISKLEEAAESASAQVAEERDEYAAKVQLFVGQLEQMQQVGKIGLEGAKRAREAEKALSTEVDQLTKELHETQEELQQLKTARQEELDRRKLV
jgi:hypothetical protein